MTIEYRHLAREELIQLGGLDVALAVQDIEEMFRLLANGECVLPSKVVLRWGGPETEKIRGHINAMPGYVGGTYDMAGIKWISVMRQNPTNYGLPVSAALTILNDPIKGIPVAVMDGSLISTMRTGATSGVATKYLARQDSKTVALFGAGVSARTQLMALRTVLPNLSKVRVYNVEEQHSQTFCEEMRDDLDMILEVARSAEEAAVEADIIVNMVSAAVPMLERGSFPSGCLFLELGLNGCELAAVPDFDKILTDSWQEIQHRGTPTLARAKAEGIISDDDVYSDLGEVVLGTKVGRGSAAERILFTAVGMGIQDIAVATRILRQAEKDGVGRMLKL